MSTLELKVPPLVQVLLTGLGMYLSANALPAARFTISNSDVVVIVMMIAGALVILAGQQTLRRHGTTVNPLVPDSASAIVLTGIFRLSRNPIYLGMLIWVVAYAIHVGNYVSALFVPCFVAYMTRFQIIPEERALREKFGEPFVKYMQTVRRWI